MIPDLLIFIVKWFDLRFCTENKKLCILLNSDDEFEMFLWVTDSTVRRDGFCEVDRFRNVYHLIVVGRRGKASSI